MWISHPPEFFIYVIFFHSNEGSTQTQLDVVAISVASNRKWALQNELQIYFSSYQQQSNITLQVNFRLFHYTISYKLEGKLIQSNVFKKVN